MVPQVAIARAELLLELPTAPPETAERFTVGLLEEAERQLDRQLPVLREVVAIPRLELELSLEESDATGRRLVDAIARVLANAIVERVGAAETWGDPEEERSPPGLVRALRQGGAGGAGGARILLSLAEAASRGRDGTELPASLRTAGESIPGERDDHPGAWLLASRDLVELLERLGSFARRRRLSELAGLEVGVRRRLLRRLEDSLTRRIDVDEPDSEEAESVGPALAEASRKADAALVRFVGSERLPVVGFDEHEARLLLTVAILVRLSPRALTGDRTLMGALRPVLRGAAAREDPGLVSSSDGERVVVPAEGSRESRSALGAQPEGGPSKRSRDRDRGREETATPALDEQHWLWTAAAGLGFFVGPLRDLGVHEAASAVGGAPAQVVHWVLRRLLVLEAPALAFDPAGWVLAGLLAQPEEEERREDLRRWTGARSSALGNALGVRAEAPIEAFDAWAAALADDVRRRLRSSGANLRALIARPGLLLQEEDGLELSMGFPASYRELLLGGLLADVERVPWLECEDRQGGRLRFVFHEENQGGNDASE